MNKDTEHEDIFEEWSDEPTVPDHPVARFLVAAAKEMVACAKGCMGLARGLPDVHPGDARGLPFPECLPGEQQRRCFVAYDAFGAVDEHIEDCRTYLKAEAFAIEKRTAWPPPNPEEENDR